jgi:hypothetical protein
MSGTADFHPASPRADWLPEAIPMPRAGATGATMAGEMLCHGQLPRTATR